MKLIKFFRAFNISQEEENKLDDYKKEINEINKTEEIQELLKISFKRIAYDQIKQALNDFLPSLKESDLAPESQNDIRELVNEDAGSKVKDAKSAKKIRNGILGEIETIKGLFDTEKELREDFSEEIKNRLELVKKNS